MTTIAELPDRARRVLVVNADGALYDLIEEWLSGSWLHVTRDDDANAVDACDLVIVDIPFPRQGGHELLSRIARAHPDTPVIALSSTFLPGAGLRHSLANALGVAAALPKPVRREQLVAATMDLMPRRP